MTPIDKYNTYNCCGYNMFLGNKINYALKLKINKDKLLPNYKTKINAKDKKIHKNNNNYSFPI